MPEMSRTVLNLSDCHSVATKYFQADTVLTLGHCYPLILGSDIFLNCQQNNAQVSYTAILYFTTTTKIASPASVIPSLVDYLYLCLFNE